MAIVYLYKRCDTLIKHGDKYKVTYGVTYPAHPTHPTVSLSVNTDLQGIGRS